MRMQDTSLAPEKFGGKEKEENNMKRTKWGNSSQLRFTLVYTPG